MQLNCEMVSKGNLKPCYKMKPEVPGTWYLDHIAAGMSYAFSEHTSLLKTSKILHKNKV